jgi:hypothetical protein
MFNVEQVALNHHDASEIAEYNRTRSDVKKYLDSCPIFWGRTQHPTEHRLLLHCGVSV